MPASFMGLPAEIRVHIIDAIDSLSDVLRCRVLCSEIRHIMDESIWLRYRQSLAAANMVDSGCSTLSTAERLEKLEQTEQSWSRLAWRHEDMYRVDQPWTGGGLRKIYIGNYLFWSITNSVGNAFNIRNLRGHRDDLRMTWTVDITSAFKWSSKKDKRNYRHIGTIIEPVEDLLVTVHEASGPSKNLLRIRLSAITTGSAHPEARLPLIEKNLDHTDQGWWCQLGCQKDLLGVVFYDHESEKADELFIWNWKSYDMVVHLRVRDWFGGFAFLDDQHFAIGFIQDSEHHESQSSSGLNVYSMEANGTLIGKVLYPSTQKNSMIRTMVFAHQASSCGVSGAGQTSTPFHTFLNDRILVIKLLLGNNNQNATLTHCISAPALLKRIRRKTQNRARHGPRSSVPKPTLQWREWATESSHLFYSKNYFPRTFFSSYGARFLECSPFEIEGVPTQKLRLTLRDFNQKGLRKGLDDATVSAGGEYGWHYHGDDTSDVEPAGLASMAQFFRMDAHDLATTLPYRSVSRLIDIPQNAHATWCSAGMAENTILLHFQTINEEEWIKILPLSPST